MRYQIWMSQAELDGSKQVALRAIRSWQRGLAERDWHILPFVLSYINRLTSKRNRPPNTVYHGIQAGSSPQLSTKVHGVSSSVVQGRRKHLHRRPSGPATSPPRAHNLCNIGRESQGQILASFPPDLVLSLCPFRDPERF